MPPFPFPNSTIPDAECSSRLERLLCVLSGYHSHLCLFQQIMEFGSLSLFFSVKTFGRWKRKSDDRRPHFLGPTEGAHGSENYAGTSTLFRRRPRGISALCKLPQAVNFYQSCFFLSNLWSQDLGPVFGVQDVNSPWFPLGSSLVFSACTPSVRRLARTTGESSHLDGRHTVPLAPWLGEFIPSYVYIPYSTCTAK